MRTGGDVFGSLPVILGQLKLLLDPFGEHRCAGEAVSGGHLHQLHGLVGVLNLLYTRQEVLHQSIAGDAEEMLRVWLIANTQGVQCACILPKTLSEDIYVSHIYSGH